MSGRVPTRPDVRAAGIIGRHVEIASATSDALHYYWQGFARTAARFRSCGGSCDKATTKRANAGESIPFVSVRSIASLVCRRCEMCYLPTAPARTYPEPVKRFTICAKYLRF